MVEVALQFLPQGSTLETNSNLTNEGGVDLQSSVLVDEETVYCFKEMTKSSSQEIDPFSDGNMRYTIEFEKI